MRKGDGGFAAKPIAPVAPLVLGHRLPLPFHAAANCHPKGATHEPYQTKP